MGREYGPLTGQFREAEKDHPLELCAWCKEMVRVSDLMRTYQDLRSIRNEESRKGMEVSMRRRFWKPDMTETDIDKLMPKKTCKKCWALVRTGKVGGGMTENGMGVVELPAELRALNDYEQILVSRARPFVSVVRLKPCSKTRIPNRLLLPATKGNSANLRIPIEETISHVLDTLPLAANPERALRIYAEVKSSSGTVWRNLVDMEKVVKALEWLKANNPVYATVTVDREALLKVDPKGFLSLMAPQEPAETDPNLEAEAMDEGDGNPLPPLSNPQHILTQKERHEITAQYSLEPMHDQVVKVGDDIEQYMQTRIKGQPLADSTKDLDLACYPGLYPTGKDGLDQSGRSAALRPREYYGHRLRSVDPRWRRCLSWMHAAHFHKRDRAISQGIYASTKTGARLAAGLTASDMIGKLKRKEVELENELSTLFQTIKGTKEYWARQSSDLGAMDAELGPATFFVTLSCAETKWVELEDFLRKRNCDLPSAARVGVAELIAKDPAAVSEFFNRRFEAMMKVLTAPGGGPLGEVEHWYWRLEYQARGAPHIHMKLWVKDAPILGAEGVTEDEVKSFIAKYITCQIPSDNENAELRKLVEKYQMHKCTKSCLRFKRGRKKGSTGCMMCRYGFPRPTQQGYKINSIEEVVKTKTKKKGKPKRLYQIPRTKKEVSVNDYNPALLMMWKANVDVQYVGEVSRVLNNYITGYITKGEKNQTEMIWDALRSDGKSVPSRLRSLVHQSNRDREVGSYEIIDDLLGHALHGSSDAVVWLGIGMPSKRRRKFLTYKQLLQVKPDSTRILAQNIVEDYYKKRHVDLEGCSLHVMMRDWVYESANGGKDPPEGAKMNEGGKGWFRRRKPVIVKTPYIPCKPDRAEEYFQLLIQQFVPYRKEGELLHGCETWAEAFGLWVKECAQLRDGKQKREDVDAGKDLLRRLEEEAQDEEKAEEQESDEEPDDGEVDAPGAVDPNGFRSVDDYGTAEGLKSRVASLNAKQKAVWDEVTGEVEHQLRHEKGMCQCGSMPTQILKFVSGGAGVGKSRLIETLTEAIEMSSEREVVLAAPSGLAAQNIDGQTIHRAFKLPIQKNKGAWEYEPLKHEAEKELGEQIGDSKLIVIDEISMVSNVMLEFVKERLNSLKGMTGEDDVFGGMNVVVLGDLLQLPPVNAPYCFQEMAAKEWRKCFKGGIGAMTPGHLWRRFDYAELTENMRQQNDRSYADLLNRLRVADVSSGMEMLESRLVEAASTPKDIAELLSRLILEGKSPVCLLAKVDLVLNVNAAMLIKEGIQFQFIHALDQKRHRKPTKQQAKMVKKTGDETADIVAYLAANTEKKANETGGLVQVVAIGVNARVMLTRNVDVTEGLYNGAMGTVSKIVHTPSDPTFVRYVKVRFDADPSVEVDVDRCSVTYKSGQIKVKRQQFPLTLAYAITIHKSQGLSLDCVVTDLGSDIFSSWMSYVALSRVKTLDGLYLLGLDKERIWCDVAAVKEYNRLRKLYTKLPELQCGKRAGPLRSVLQKPKISRPLAQAGLDLTAPPPVKKPRKAKPAGVVLGKRKTGESAVVVAKAVPAKKARVPDTVARYSGVGFVPLTNPSDNRCFCNSAVQSLLSASKVRGWALGGATGGNGLRSHFKLLVEAQAAGGSDSKSTKKIRDAISLSASRSNAPWNFADGTQHDSFSFLEYLIRSNDELSEMFGFFEEVESKCRTCGTVTLMSSNPSSSVSLRRPLKARGGVVSFDYLLESELSGVAMKRCDVCTAVAGLSGAAEALQPDEIHDTRKKYIFPDECRLVLVTISRFAHVQGPDGRLVLGTNNVPLEQRSSVKVGEYSTGNVVFSGTQFRTVAAVVHEGESPNAGHYIAVTNHEGVGDLKWLQKSDTMCEKMSRFVNQLSTKNGSVYYMVLSRD